MWLILLIIAGWFLLGPACGPGVAFFILASHLILYSQHFSLSQWLIYLSVVLSIPIAAFISGHLLDNYGVGGPKGRAFRNITPVLAIVFALHDPRWSNIIENALTLGQNTSPEKAIGFFCSLTGLIFVCSALTVGCILLAQLVFELPCRWLLISARVRSDLPYESFRSLGVIFLIGLAFNLISGLFVQELGSQSLVALQATTPVKAIEAPNP